MSYEQDMYIDEDALDVELLGQADKMVKYSRMLAEAQRDRDLSKESLDLIKAEIDLDIRDNPEKYKLTKITVDAVHSCILMEEEYQDAQKEVNRCTFEANVLVGVIKAIDHRKSALEHLVKLYGQNYFAGPSIPHNLSELREEHTAKLEHRIGQSLTRTTPKKENK
jgi:hypothetical protein